MRDAAREARSVARVVEDGRLAAPSAATDRVRGRGGCGRPGPVLVVPLRRADRRAAHEGGRRGAGSEVVDVVGARAAVLRDARREQVAVGTGRLGERGALALLHDAAVVEDRQQPGALDRGEPVRDEHARAPREQALRRGDDARLRERVHARRRLVEHDDLDVAHQQAGERDELLLPAESDVPPGPSSVSRPSGRPATQSSSRSSRTAASTSDRGTSANSATFSASVPARISVRCVTTPTAARSAWRSRSRTSTPPTRTAPRGGSTARDSSDARVDLPEPVRPTSATVSPRARAGPPRRARTCPRRRRSAGRAPRSRPARRAACARPSARARRRASAGCA